MPDHRIPLFSSTNYLNPSRIDVISDALVGPALAVALTVSDVVIALTFSPERLASATAIWIWQIPVCLHFVWRVTMYLLFIDLFGSLAAVWLNIFRSDLN